MLLVHIPHAAHIHPKTLCCERLKLFTSKLSLPPLPTLCSASNKAIWKWQGVPLRKQPLPQPASLPLKWEDSESSATQSPRGPSRIGHQSPAVITCSLMCSELAAFSFLPSASWELFLIELLVCKFSLYCLLLG